MSKITRISSRRARARSVKLPDDAVTPEVLRDLERLAQPGACLVGVDEMRYILSGRRLRCSPVKPKNLQVLIAQGWVSEPVARSCGEQQKFPEHFLTKAGREQYQKILKARAENARFKQEEFAEMADVPQKEVAHA